MAGSSTDTMVRTSLSSGSMSLASTSMLTLRPCSTVATSSDATGASFKPVTVTVTVPVAPSPPSDRKYSNTTSEVSPKPRSAKSSRGSKRTWSPSSVVTPAEVPARDVGWDTKTISKGTPSGWLSLASTSIRIAGPSRDVEAVSSTATGGSPITSTLIVDEASILPSLMVYPNVSRKFRDPAAGT